MAPLFPWPGAARCPATLIPARGPRGISKGPGDKSEASDSPGRWHLTARVAVRLNHVPLADPISPSPRTARVGDCASPHSQKLHVEKERSVRRDDTAGAPFSVAERRGDQQRSLA